MSHLLLADDDIELCEMLAEYLKPEGFDVDKAHDGESALEKALSMSYDLVILDVMMPKLNGFDVLRQLRTQSLIPVLMLTAKGDDIDSVLGLELGADDYLPKPCNPRVLVARIRAILRRAAVQSEDSELAQREVLQVGDIKLDPGSRGVFRCGEAITLTSTEYSVLEVLLRETGRIVSKERLSEEALGRKLMRFDRSLDMHISNLRKKLGPPADGTERIQTIRGVGYLYTQTSNTNSHA